MDPIGEQAIMSLSDLEARAADELSGMSFSRYKIEAKRLVKEMGEEEAYPILAKWVSQWAERDQACAQRNHATM